MTAVFARRQLLLGGLVLLVESPAIAQCCSNYAGCGLLDGQLSILLAGAGATSAFNLETDATTNGSGDRDFDYALAQTLASLSDEFSVLPGFAFFDQGNSYNAFASTSTRLGRTDGSVIFGKTLLRSMLSDSNLRETGVASVCAHEFGHITQYKHRIPDRLVTSNGRVKRLELHADFLAGFYAGRRKRANANFPAAIFAVAQDSVGDTNYTDRNHHGTSAERGAAVVQGFQASYRDRLGLADAIERGITYVLSISG